MSSAQVSKKAEKKVVVEKKAAGEKKVKAEVKKVEVKVEKVVEAKTEKKPRAKKVVVEKEEQKDEVKEEVKEEVKKVPATADSVQTELTSVIDQFSKSNVSELTDLKQAVKLVRQTASRLKKLRNDLTRVLKKAGRTHAPKDKSKLSNSGLMKPVSISSDLASFMGVPKDSLHSRVSVTNALCNYIKEKNLQNPENKRHINPDSNLSKILGYKADGGQPLTYFYIQQLIQPHFLKEVSSEMCKFMSVPDHSLQSTASLVSAVVSYATKKNLVHDGNVTLDDTLSKLVGKTGVVSKDTLPQLVKSQFKK
jgi:chromatin remodeling complex protein RSC6